MEENGKIITAEKIKNIYYGNDDSKKSLLQLFAEHYSQISQLIGKGYVSATVQRYNTTARYLKEFMQKKYHVADIQLDEINPAFTDVKT